MPTQTTTEGRLVLSDDQVRSLAGLGTPLYVIDEGHLRRRVRRYLAAFRAAWEDSELTFASKANSTLAVLRIAWQEGLLIDVASEGELRAALRAGVPADRCHMHGNNKKPGEIRFAIEAGINQIVVDNFEEIAFIGGLSGAKPDIIVRLAPGVDPKTHAKISTGQADTKFGFNIADGSGERALVAALEAGLDVKGFHCHVGSQLLDPEAQISGGELLAQFAADMRAKHGYEAQVINVGGGLGVHYVGDARPLPVEEYCAQIVAQISRALAPSGLRPKLVQEPGRSIIGESGVTLYTVGAVKEVPSASKGRRVYVAVDGGLSDNPRPVMYGSKYDVVAVSGDGRGFAAGRPATVSGKHCETDMLFEDVMLPSDIRAGDHIQVLVTGAYNSAMASNYNRYQRPGTALLREDGSAVMVQRPETWDEMFARESVPEDL
ncbi:MAG: diaminopimelate decarboxylase [Fimbriimonadaceae bacterium]|nr:diaminopimelate decarboxylase [Fimbriimonadaceae bacterium]